MNAEPSVHGGTWREDIGLTLVYGGLVLLMLAARWVAWPEGVSVHEVQAALAVAVTLGAWAFGLVPEPLPTLAFFLLAVLFDVASTEVIFSGFTSTAWWLVFGGSVVGVAITTTGVGSRIASAVFASRRPSYQGYVVRVAILAVCLAFLMPSTSGRILLLTPIVLALAKDLGYERGSKGHTGLVLAVAASSYMPPTTILPANLPNSVLLGAAESLYGVKLSYGAYLLMHFPVMGLLKTVVIVGAILRLFPEQRPCRDLRNGPPTPLTGDERRLLWLLGVSVLLFMTDFVHGVSPAWISLGTAVVCLWPTTRLVSAKSFADRVHVTPLIYVAGFLGLGAVVSASGLGLRLGNALLGLAHLSPDAPLANGGILAAIGAGIGLVTTLPSLPAVFTPLAQEFATASGLPLYTVLMLQVPVYGIVFLPYQCPPMVIAMGMGGVGMKDGSKLCLAVAAISIAVLIPLTALWWRLLGYL